MTNSKTPNLLSLHPEELSEEDYSAYEEEFEKVLSDPRCRNIALSGPYGAGKSSVIEKVMKNRSKTEERWITVSLATFGKTNEEGPEVDVPTQNTIEAEVLRQMVHKIGTSKAPKSSFRQLCDHSKVVDAILSVSIVVFCLLTVYLTSIAPNLLSQNPSREESCALLVWSLIAVAGLYHLVRTNTISKIVRRVKLFEAELEITPSSSMSPYERCVDEIVYLLNASKVDAVVFEDLDRFDSMAIFEKMRDLNTLTNDSRFYASKKKGTVKPLRFFYLIRDGLFTNPHDRTKFFDFIIPVVPYTDPNNALDIMRNALEGVDLSIDEGFLYQLSSYIDDPRIIHDIADEAYHYKKVLFKERQYSEGDAERLIALLSYKALFPKDFELLQIGRGYLHEVLSGKQRLIRKMTRTKEIEREHLHEELNNIDRQLKVSEDELICMYGAPEMQRVASYTGTHFISDSNPHSFLEEARKNRLSAPLLNELQSGLEKNEEYTTRLKEVRGDADRRSNLIKARLAKIDERLDALQAMTLKQLIDETANADPLFNFKDSEIERAADFEELSMSEVIGSPFFPMVRFLVSSGYIDESYRRYISNFYSNLLCAEDDDYLAAIRQAKPIDLNYEPKSPGEIVRRMDQSMFARRNIRNPWLVSALFDSKNNRKIDAFMSSVKRTDGVCYLAQFIASDQFNPKVFRLMFEYFDDPIADLLNDEGIDANDKRCFCKRYLTAESEDALQEEKNGIFIRYIEMDSYFLEADSRFDDNVIKEKLLHIGYRAAKIKFPSADPVLLDFIYENRLFAPTASIVDGYLNMKHGVCGSLDNGTVITETIALQDGPIKDVVSKDMDYFVSSVLEESKTSLKDTQEVVISVLNEQDIQAETAELYIANLANVEVENVSQVSSEYYRNQLLSAQLVKCNANNIISFYRAAGNTITDDLADLIEAQGAPLDLNEKNCDVAGVDKADIVTKIIRSKRVSIENKRLILERCGFVFTAFDIDSVDDKTLSAMIDTGAIAMNVEMLEEFRLHKPNLTVSYVLSDLDGYLALIDPENAIEEDELIGILESGAHNDKKLTALSYFNGTVRLNGSYGDEINAAIVSDHLNQANIVSLPSYYADASTALKDQIARAVAKHSDVIISEGVSLSWELACDALKCLSADRTQALRLLERHIRTCASEGDRGRVLECFESASLDDYVRLVKGSQSMIPDTNIDDAVLEALHDLEMCGAITNKVNTKGRRRVYPKGRHSSAIKPLNELD